ncbi:hypothetical protein BR93DRAFT_269799 [Coniochaeta sp. PMI_546]|nr:hypothetical protein BR93DRAFT_269799 [Coniochaeta sp. PMI_546]
MAKELENHQSRHSRAAPMLLRPSFLLPCHKPACSCPSGSDFKLGLPIVVFTGSMVLGPWDSIIPSRIGLVTFSTVLTTKCTSIFVAATVGQRLEQQSHLRCRHVTVGVFAMVVGQRQAIIPRLAKIRRLPYGSLAHTCNPPHILHVSWYKSHIHVRNK